MLFGKKISFKFLYWVGLGGLAGGILVNMFGKFVVGIQPEPSRLYIGLAILLLCVCFWFADQRQQQKARTRD